MSDRSCVLQDDLKDCGVCSLLSIIRYYHGDVSKEYLRELTNTTKDGVSALNLLKASRELGFEAYGIKGKIKDLNKKILPAIAHVIIDSKYPHFVVIYGINYRKNQVLIMDPAIGFKKYSFSNYMKITTDYYLIMKPKQIIPKLVNENNYFTKIRLIIGNYKSILITIIIASVIYMMINVIESYQFKLLYESNNLEVKVIFYILIILLIGKSIFTYLRNNLICLFNTVLDRLLIKDAFYHIINLPYLYYRNHTNGDLLTRINDLSNAKELISNLLVSILVDFIFAIPILFVMLKIDLLLSMINVMALFIYGLIAYFDSKLIKLKIRQNCQESSLVNNCLVESFSSFETIKNLSIQKYVYKRFLEKYIAYSDNLKKLINHINVEEILKNIFISGSNILVIYFGIIKINNNELLLSSLITFISLSNYLIDPVKNLLGMHLQYQNFKESILRIREIYTIPQEVVNKNKRVINLLGKIEVSDLKYSYNGIDYVINNISFEILEGERVLIFGDSGCGKSTIIKLLIKYLDSSYQGEIKVGGYDLKHIDIFSLRSSICYVSQNEFLYTDSIYENIALGRNIKYSSFLEVANNLYINEIIKNSSLGYNYVIEDNGANISGGERKKIIIARTLFQNANIYVYDETFSEIDVARERKILEYIFNRYPDKTIIIISHRFSNADLFNKKIKVGEGNYEFVG